MKYFCDNQLIQNLKSLSSPTNQEVIAQAIALLRHRQAHIDSLMFEWEPDEMPKEQIDNWANRQQPVPEPLVPIIG